METVAIAIRRFVQENLLFGQRLAFSDQDSFLEQGIIDSTGVLELVTFLEDQYGFTVEDEELVPENLDSIANVVQFVAEKQGVAQVAS